MKLLYPAVFKEYEDKSGGYVVEFPDLPGCVTGGDTMREAMEMAQDAACGWILVELERGNDIPSPSKREAITLENNSDFVNIMELDIDKYNEAYGKKAVHKNLTIPAWLNALAEKNNINYSKLLQEALLKKVNVV